MIVKNISELIGNTPILEIPQYLNPFGSLKDRAALWLLKDKFEELKTEQKTVIESSSGNMAKAMAVLCEMNGIKFKTVTNRIHVSEVRDVLNALGAEVEELPGMSACPDPADPNNPVAMIDGMVAANPDQYYHPNQYTNQLNIQAHYETTGPEILNDLGRVDFVLSALGTTGSSGGVTKYLREQGQNARSIGVIGARGDIIPGIRNRDEMKEVGIFEFKNYAEILEISSKQAVEGMLTLNRKLGLLVGPTTGAVFARGLEYLKEQDETTEPGSKAVFIACDRLEWYLSYLKKHRPELFEKTEKAETAYNMRPETLQFGREVEPREAEELISRQALVVDLRGNMAYRISHIEGAVNITDMFMDDLIENGTPFQKDREILLVCPSGQKSLKYSALLNSRGLDTYSLKGGMTEYRKYTKGLKSELSKH
ncbi:MAG: pyridoxal-phosphate dependent enzyme [Candidatus Saccharibacteria bacterium]|nr:pyridoxal-phosphate dependent enzyme [Candidatus Saccharibacteria bacterium]